MCGMHVLSSKITPRLSVADRYNSVYPSLRREGQRLHSTEVTAPTLRDVRKKARRIFQPASSIVCLVLHSAECPDGLQYRGCCVVCGCQHHIHTNSNLEFSAALWHALAKMLKTERIAHVQHRVFFFSCDYRRTGALPRRPDHCRGHCR